MHPPQVEVVVPVFQCRDALYELHSRLTNSLPKITQSYKIIFVDDRSTDGSREVLHEIRTTDPNVEVIESARNFGQHFSIARGLSLTTAPLVVVMDGDLQHPPEEISKLISRIDERCDVAVGVCPRKHYGFIRRMATAGFYSVAHFFGIPPIASSTTNFCALSKIAVQSYLCAPGNGQLFLAVLSKLKLPFTTVAVEVVPRPFGRSSYSLQKLLRLAWVSLKYRLIDFERQKGGI